MITLLIIIGIAILLLIRELANSWRRPPGPIRFPLLGTMIQISRAHPVGFIAIDKLSKKYGDVMSIKLGLTDFIVVSSYEAIKFFYGGNDCGDRPCEGIWLEKNFNKNLGVMFSNGDVWVEMKKFVTQTGRHCGFFNRIWIQRIVREELNDLRKRIDEEISTNPDNVIEFTCSGLMKISFTNLITSFISGKRHSYDDNDFQELIISMEKFFRASSSGTAVLTAFPLLRFVMGKSLGYDIQMESTRGTQTYCKKIIEYRKSLAKFKEGEPTCLVDAFLQKMEETEDDPNTSFTEEQLLVILSDIFIAGTETTGNLVQFTILLLMTHPDKQEKLYQEIISMIGPTRIMEVEERNRLIYLQAVLLESHRWAKVAISLAPRKATIDIKYKDYIIKKGTIVTANMYAVFQDKEYWGDPDIFRPERFIGRDGMLTKTERMVPFGMGKRICLGEQLAKDSSILYITTLVQNYEFRVPEEHYGGKLPSLKLVEGITTCPVDFKAKVLKRR